MLPPILRTLESCFEDEHLITFSKMTSAEHLALDQFVTYNIFWMAGAKHLEITEPWSVTSNGRRQTFGFDAPLYLCIA